MSVHSLIDEAFAFHQQGHLDDAEALYRTALETDPDNFQALQLLGTLALRAGRVGEALVFLERALTLLKQRGDEAKRHAALYNNLGIALRTSGRSADAVDYFKQGLELDPELTELHVSLGSALMERGDAAGAARSFEAALRLNPDLPECLCDLGTIYAQGGRTENAIAMYRRALSIAPSHWAARINLAQMLRQTEKHAEAIALLTRLAEEAPHDLTVRGQLGIAYTASNRYDLALDHFAYVLLRKPDDAEAMQYVANIKQALGDTKEADRNYRRSFELRPLITIPATQTPPAFRVLLLFAPGAGNTPLDCLVEQAEYENNILNLLPDITYDADMLRAHADIAVNLIADADQSHAALPPAAELLDRIGRPVINHPRKIMQTDRESIAALLMNMPGCIVPRTCRYAAAALRDPGFSCPLSFPFLMRPTGTHGGVDFGKIDDKTQFDAFIGHHPSSDCYLTEYIDFRSADGFFRKYRFIFIGGDVFAYHVAIDDKWKIHHVTTDMENQPWMQEEEKSFLENPHAVFGPAHYDTLRAIEQRVGLEFSGIDCALDREGRIVVFEVNACMLVHQHNEKFPYKTEPVRRIKAAFDAMLKRVAAEAGRKAA